MRKIHICLFIFLIFSFCSLNLFGQTAKKIDEFILPFVKMRVFNGCVLIAEGDSIKFNKCYGKADYENDVDNKPLTEFRIASLSKSFAEIAVELLEKHKLLLKTDKLDKFYPQIKGADKITIEHLLNHRSGIPHINDYPDYDNLAKLDYTADEVIALFKDRNLLFEPGTQRKYSNSGYVLLASIIEKVSGKTYQEFLKENIFQPAGMSNTFIEERSQIVKNKAWGYQPHPWNDEMMKSEYWSIDIKIGGGDITSTTEDIYKFFKHYYSGKFGIKPEIPEDKTKADYYQGNSPGYASYVRKYFDRDVYVIVLANNYSRAPWRIGKTLGEIYKGNSVKFEFPKEYKRKISEGLLRLHNADGWEFFLMKQSAKFAVFDNDRGKPDYWRGANVYPIAENEFFMPWYMASLTFNKKADGEFEIKWKDF